MLYQEAVSINKQISFYNRLPKDAKTVIPQPHTTPSSTLRLY